MAVPSVWVSITIPCMKRRHRQLLGGEAIAVGISAPVYTNVQRVMKDQPRDPYRPAIGEIADRDVMIQNL